MVVVWAALSCVVASPSFSLVVSPLFPLPKSPNSVIDVPVAITASNLTNTSTVALHFALPGFRDCLQNEVCARFGVNGSPSVLFEMPAMQGPGGGSIITVPKNVSVLAPVRSSLNLLEVRGPGDVLLASSPVAFGGELAIQKDPWNTDCKARVVILPFPPPANLTLMISVRSAARTRDLESSGVTETRIEGGTSQVAVPFNLTWRDGRGVVSVRFSGSAADFFKRSTELEVKANCSEYDYGDRITQALMVLWVTALVVSVYTLFAVFGARPVADIAAVGHRPQLLTEFLFFTFQVYCVGSFSSGFNFDMLYLTPSERASAAVPFAAALGIVALSFLLRAALVKKGGDRAAGGADDAVVISSGSLGRRLAWMMLVPAVQVFISSYRVDERGASMVVSGILMGALAVAAPVFEVWRPHDLRPRRFVQWLLCWHLARAAAVPAILFIDYDRGFSLGHGLALLFILGGAGSATLLFQPFGPNLLVEPYAVLGALTAASAVGYLPVWRYRARRTGRFGGDVPSPDQTIAATVAAGLVSVLVAARVAFLLVQRLRHEARVRMRDIISDARDSEFAEFSFLMPRAVVRSVMTAASPAAGVDGADCFREGTVDASPSSSAFLRADDPCHALLRVIDMELTRRGCREEGKFPWKPVMSRVTLGFNPVLFKAFVQRFKILSTRSAELRAAWQDEPGAGDRQQVEKVRQDLTSRIVGYVQELMEKDTAAQGGQARNSAPSDLRGTDSLRRHMSGDAAKAASAFTADHVRAAGLDLVWHGAPIPAITSIMRTGFVNLKRLNTGWFGTGVYTTHFSGYAAYYFTRGFTTSENLTPQGEHALLLSWALTGTAFPVTNRIDRIDDPGHIYHGGYPGADCHYALVKFGGEVCTDYSTSPPDHLYDEIAIWQESQLLPFAIVFFYLK